MTRPDPRFAMAPPAPKRRSALQWLGIAALASSGAFVAIIIVAALSRLPAPAAVPAFPSPSVAPTVTLAPADALAAAVADALGEGNRDVPRLDFVRSAEDGTVRVRWAINRGLTDRATNDNAREDAVRILRAIHESGVEYTQARLLGTYAMVDAYGNPSESEVVTLEFDRETVQKIRWDNIDFVVYQLPDNIYALADKDDVARSFLRD